MATELLDFDVIQPTTIDVVYKGQHYTLEEASEEAQRVWRNAITNSAILSPEGKMLGYRNLAEVEPLLLSYCLRDQEGKLVPRSKLATWPGRITSSLYARVKEISMLNRESEEEHKLFKKALETSPEAPVTWTDLVAWVKTLDPTTYKALYTLFGTTAEEQVKN